MISCCVVYFCVEHFSLLPFSVSRTLVGREAGVFNQVSTIQTRCDFEFYREISFIIIIITTITTLYSKNFKIMESVL